MSDIIKNRLQSLRRDMKIHQIDAVIIPSGDAHQSEYIASHWAIRTWISGFTGSAGTLIVLMDDAALWTDPRYFIQAEMELTNSGITLHKQTIPHAPEHVPWLSLKLKAGQRIGMDSRLFSISQMDYIRTLFSSRDLIISPIYNPFDRLWTERPALPNTPVFEHTPHFCGDSNIEKINTLRNKLTLHQADYLLISTLDDIAWVLNLRGSDIPFNPLFYAYLLVGKEECFLFLNENKIPPYLNDKLYNEKIRVLPYDSITESLLRLVNEATIIIHPESLNAAIHSILPAENIIPQPNWVMELKAIKSEKEISHIKKAMQKDGVALISAFIWLEKSIHNGEVITEYDFAEKCAFFRSQQEDYRGESFPAIIGFNSNGAIIHYHPEQGQAATIKKGGLLLVDSGGQYLDGTTDITRTIFLGDNPPDKIKKHFTLVLKGFISLAKAHFPAGTVGMQLDTLARRHLWQEGLNYPHGTGHGVGFYLSVHEGPQGFATNPATSRGTTAFKPGMITTNEPGVYLEGEYGIRIENILVCREKDHNFLHFEDLTLFPISQTLTDVRLLNQDEKEWLNNYHQMVWDCLSPFISDDEKAWLNKQCLPI